MPQRLIVRLLWTFVFLAVSTNCALGANLQKIALAAG